MSDLGEPKTTDYCKVCGQSPDSGVHLFEHEYVDPRPYSLTPRVNSFTHIADDLQSEVNRLAELNRKAAESRRFRRGPFDFTEDRERASTMRVLDVVIGALRREASR